MVEPQPCTGENCDEKVTTTAALRRLHRAFVTQANRAVQRDGSFWQLRETFLTLQKSQPQSCYQDRPFGLFELFELFELWGSARLALSRYSARKNAS